MPEKNMNSLHIKRNLSEETRKNGVAFHGRDEVYSLHVTDDEVIITDYDDFNKIYAIYSLDYYNSMMQ